MHDLGPLAVLGMGRGSAELIDFLHETSPASSITVLDDRWSELPREFMGHPVAGPLQKARELAGRGDRVALGIASATPPGIRRDIATRLALPEGAWLTYRHPAAHISLASLLGPGTIVYPGACIAVDSQIGRWGLVYYGAVVHHDALLGDGVVLCSGVMLAGGVTVADGAYVGIGAVVTEGVRIGAGALVGAGAVVVEDVADGAVVAGVPARALAR
jgi:sugar O-acyltransferase (sialic acid O-acetyltransferase NeuD family)